MIDLAAFIVFVVYLAWLAYCDGRRSGCGG